MMSQTTVLRHHSNTFDRTELVTLATLFSNPCGRKIAVPIRILIESSVPEKLFRQFELSAPQSRFACVDTFEFYRKIHNALTHAYNRQHPKKTFCQRTKKRSGDFTLCFSFFYSDGGKRRLTKSGTGKGENSRPLYDVSYYAFPITSA